MNEIWKDIAGYEGYYKVSDLGNFMSYDRVVNSSYNAKRTVKGKSLKARLDSQKRYMLIDLSKGRVKKTILAHRIVAIAHVDNPLNLPEVNHKFGNTQSLLATDLEWSSRSDNEKHKYRVLKCPHPSTGKTGKLHVKSMPVIKYDLLTGATIAEYESNRLAEKDGYGCCGISKCCNGKQPAHKGFGWKFKTLQAA